MSVTDFPVMLASNSKEWCDWMWKGMVGGGGGEGWWERGGEGMVGGEEVRDGGRGGGEGWWEGRR